MQSHAVRPVVPPGARHMVSPAGNEFSAVISHTQVFCSFIITNPDCQVSSQLEKTVRSRLVLNFAEIFKVSDLRDLRPLISYHTALRCHILFHGLVATYRGHIECACARGDMRRRVRKRSNFSYCAGTWYVVTRGTEHCEQLVHLEGVQYATDLIRKGYWAISYQKPKSRKIKQLSRYFKIFQF